MVGGGGRGRGIDAPSRAVQQGPGLVESPSEASNIASLLRRTTVRVPNGTPETPGYRRYVGCPPVPQNAMVNKKRKAGGAARGGTGGAGGSKFRRQPAITNPAILAIVRKHLRLHSENYANSSMTVQYDGSSTYRVLLSGDGATWCRNKGDEHNRQHVYMEIVRGNGNRYEARMRCWCQCPTARGSGVLCKAYKSPTTILDANEVGILFPQKTADPNMILKSLQAELDAMHKE